MLILNFQEVVERLDDLTLLRLRVNHSMSQVILSILAQRVGQSLNSIPAYLRAIGQRRQLQVGTQQLTLRQAAITAFETQDSELTWYLVAVVKKTPVNPDRPDLRLAPFNLLLLLHAAAKNQLIVRRLIESIRFVPQSMIELARRFLRPRVGKSPQEICQGLVSQPLDEVEQGMMQSQEITLPQGSSGNTPSSQEMTSVGGQGPPRQPKAGVEGETQPKNKDQQLDQWLVSQVPGDRTINQLNSSDRLPYHLGRLIIQHGALPFLLRPRVRGARPGFPEIDLQNFFPLLSHLHWDLVHDHTTWLEMVELAFQELNPNYLCSFTACSCAYQNARKLLGQICQLMTCLVQLPLIFFERLWELIQNLPPDTLPPCLYRCWMITALRANRRDLIALLAVNPKDSLRFPTSPKDLIHILTLSCHEGNLELIEEMICEFTGTKSPKRIQGIHRRETKSPQETDFSPLNGMLLVASANRNDLHRVKKYLATEITINNCFRERVRRTSDRQIIRLIEDHGLSQLLEPKSGSSVLQWMVGAAEYFASCEVGLGGLSKSISLIETVLGGSTEQFTPRKEIAEVLPLLSEGTEEGKTEAINFLRQSPVRGSLLTNLLVVLPKIEFSLFREIFEKSGNRPGLSREDQIQLLSLCVQFLREDLLRYLILHQRLEDPESLAGALLSFLFLFENREFNINPKEMWKKGEGIFRFLTRVVGVDSPYLLTQFQTKIGHWSDGNPADNGHPLEDEIKRALGYHEVWLHLLSEGRINYFTCLPPEFIF